MFNTYFQIGLQHIADITAYDHILFIISLCAMYRLSQWKPVLILVTAFLAAPPSFIAHQARER